MTALLIINHFLPVCLSPQRAHNEVWPAGLTGDSRIPVELDVLLDMFGLFLCRLVDAEVIFTPTHEASPTQPSALHDEDSE